VTAEEARSRVLGFVRARRPPLVAVEDEDGSVRQMAITALGEIGDVLGAMKNLALMETRKLARVLATQRRVVETIDAALGDLLGFHPDLVGDASTAREIYLLVGSERGFCGDFNERVAAAAERAIPRERAASSVVVGFKLSSRLGEDPRITRRLAGATVAEEVEDVLTQTMDALAALGAGPDPVRVSVVHHAAEERAVRVERVDPFVAARGGSPGRSAPALNLEPADLLRELVHHSLDAHLHEIFYASLAAENQRRLEHMESALQRVESESTRLRLKRDALRQEEITEEIEVILVTAEALRRSGRSS